MKQLTQNLKTGNMDILEVPYPTLDEGLILVRNYYSLISAGTEGGKVITARKGYIGKAKEKPEQIKQVIESVKTEGLLPTYNKVMNKLDSPSPLGYSCAGEIIKIGEKVKGFKIGDLVACGGASASHSEIVSVPENLCVRVPNNVKMENAAYTTVASIALQGIRRADLKLGESCAIIGLGLIGQLTCQILKVAGVKVAGIDISSDMVELARKSGADLAFERKDKSLEQRINEMSGGYGVDAVIITAGTSSLDPVELAGRICRKRGKVIIVGAVPTGFSRTNYYVKELELLMSTSYGPGRYDSNYEEKGVDYPIGYVRWTENRNMQSFLDLLRQGYLDIDLLTSHVYKFEEAEKAYEMIVNKEEVYTGILLQYNTTSDIKKSITFKQKSFVKKGKPGIGFIGAGSFAQKYLLPNAQKIGNMIGVVTAQGNETWNVAQKYGFEKALGTDDEIVKEDKIDTIFIATRHNLHAQQVIKSLKNGKNVFVEKPLCMNKRELEIIRELYEKKSCHLMLGFNRRFSPFIQKTVKLLGKNSRKAINYRINAGAIPPDSWVQDGDIGGGRIIGEVCHFIDLARFIAGDRITSLSAFNMEDSLNLQDTLTINIRFANGSIANISYFANGSSTLKKEKLEVFSAGITVVIDDFKKMYLYGNSIKKFKLTNQDKGHSKEVELFLESIMNGKETPIPFNQIYESTKATFDVINSIKEQKTIIYD